MKRVNALAAVALALGCGTVEAGLTNPGFETGDITGWNEYLSGGTVDVFSFHTSEQNPPDGGPNNPSPPFPADYPYKYTPMEGDYFLAIGSGSAGCIDPDPDTGRCAPSSTPDWQTVSQMIDLAEGEMLSGVAAYDRDDTGLYLDAARVRILDDAGIEIAIPFFRSGASFPNPTPPPDYINYANGPWTPWSWTATNPGTHTYTLEYAVANTRDPNLNSFGYFDTAPAVPEPASLALFAIGLASLGSMQRRQNRLS